MVVLLCGPSGADTSQTTLGQIRRELVGQSVVILGGRAPALHGADAQPVLLDWYRAIEETPSRRRLDPSARAPYVLKGRKGTVLEVRASRVEQPAQRRDLFGDQISDDALVDPVVEVFVRVGDTLIGTSTRHAKLFGVVPLLELVDVAARDRRFVEENLDALFGTALYPVAYSIVFSPDAALLDMTDVRRLKRLRDVPGLTPLMIVKAKYIESEHAILSKVEFGDRTGLILSPLVRAERSQSVLDRVALGFLTSFPSELSEVDIAGIRAYAVVAGMSRRGVEYAWGFPDSVSRASTIPFSMTYNGRAVVSLLYGKVWQVFPR
jgi:hypothetical protein